MVTYQLDGTPNEAEAAALAAVISLLDAEARAAADSPAVPVARWHAVRLLPVQGMVPMRTAVLPHWGSIERVRRAGRAPTGIVGQ